MVGRLDAFTGTTKKLAIAGVGAAAIAGAALAFGAGAANADVVDIGGRPGASFDAHPAPEGGVRTTGKGVPNAGASDVRRAKKGAPLPPAGGEVKDGLRAVPSITGGIGTYIRMGPARNGPGLAGW